MEFIWAIVIGFVAGGSESLSDTVSGLIEKSRGVGQAQIADSWVACGENREVQHHHRAVSLGDEVMCEMIAKTGLSRSDILSRLAT